MALIKTWRVNYHTVEYRVETTDVKGLRKVMGFKAHQHDAAWDEFRRLSDDDGSTDLVQAALWVHVIDYDGSNITRVTLAAWEVEGLSR